MLKTITWLWWLTLKIKVLHIHCLTFLSSGCMPAIDSIWVLFLTFSRSRISRNPKPVTWPWLWPWIFRSNTCLHVLPYLRLQTWYEVDFVVDFNIFKGEDIKNVEYNHVTSEIKVIHFFLMTLFISGGMPAIEWTWVSTLTFSESRISENPSLVTWLWWLTLTFKVKPLLSFILFSKSFIIWFSRSFFGVTRNISITTRSLASNTLKSTCRSSLYHLFNRKWKWAINSYLDLDFEGQPSRSCD